MSDFSYDADIAVLSILLANPDLVESVNLKPFMFGSLPNQILFESITELFVQGLTPDVSLVSSKLQAKGMLEQVGGVDYLVSLAKDAGSKDNLEEFTKQVEASYKTRALASMISSAAKKLKTGTSSVDEVVLTIEQTLGNLQDNVATDSVQDISSVTREAWDFLESKIANPGITGVTTGLTDLDLLTGGFNPGKLWVVAGRPGMGKSSVMCNAVLKSAESLKGTGEYVFVFSLEMANRELVTRMLSIHTGVDLTKILFGTVNQKELDLLREGVKYINSLPIIMDALPSTDERRFLSLARRYNRTKKLRLIYLDYIQLGTERDDGQTQAIGRFTRAGKILAKELGSTNVFFSQLNRGVEMRDDKRPQLQDLKQSGSIEDDADIVLFIYRDEYYHKDTKSPGVMEMNLGKHRDGGTGMFLVSFDPTTQRITDSL